MRWAGQGLQSALAGLLAVFGAAASLLSYCMQGCHVIPVWLTAAGQQGYGDGFPAEAHVPVHGGLLNTASSGSSLSGGAAAAVQRSASAASLQGNSAAAAATGEPPPCRTIYVRSLSPDVDDAELQALFEVSSRLQLVDWLIAAAVVEQASLAESGPKQCMCCSLADVLLSAGRAAKAAGRNEKQQDSW